MNPLTAWVVRVDYVFSEARQSIDELDALVTGELLPPYGGMSHSIGNQPQETTLEWRVASLDEARAAIDKLAGARGVRDVRLAHLRHERILDSSEYAVRASDARSGKAVCVACGSHITATPWTIFAVEGVRPGNEITLTCENCGMRMDWVILPEGDLTPG